MFVDGTPILDIWLFSQWCLKLICIIYPATLRCGCMDEKSQCSWKLWFWHYYQIIFTGQPFPHPTFTGARRAHKRHLGYKNSYHRVQNSYQLFRKPWLDTKVCLLLFLHVTPSNFVHIIAKGNTFLINSPLDVTKLQTIVLRSHRLAAFHSQCQWAYILVSLTTPMVIYFM